MLSLYNSITGRIEPFVPQRQGEVRMFTCGPSIYQRPHIGNYRTFLFEDVLQRYLEFKGYRVIRALNFTDVEDKSIHEAEKLGMDVLELTEKCSRLFFDDLRKLNIKLPTYNPRSSTSVEQAVDLIIELLNSGHAYWYKGNVYYDPLKFSDFGKLGHPDMSRWPKKKRRFHRDTYPGNRWNLGDFILWHGYREGDPVYWDTKIGRGRPAWNVQDPAMATQTLGFSIDICCGGEDNLIRHHDYTIAIAESVSGKELGHYWLHGAHLLVDGKKMSKSKGNVIYLDDLLGKGYTGYDIRFFLLYGHYRKRLNFTYDKLKKTTDKLRLAGELIEIIRKADAAASNDRVQKLIGEMKQDFEKNMDNDLDIKHAFDDIVRVLEELRRMKDNISKKDAGSIISFLTTADDVLQVLGLSTIRQ